MGKNQVRFRMRRAAAVAAVAAAGGGLIALSPAPAGAHETSIQVGGAIGTVGQAHSGARLCELSSTYAYGIMHMQLGNGESGYLLANDGCQSDQYAGAGGIVRYRVGWDQGGGILWSGWRNT